MLLRHYYILAIMLREETAMEGKRISTPDAGTEAKKKLPIAGIIAAILAALLLGTMTGLCLYAGSYEKIFPGVYVGSVDLGGQDRETAQRTLSARMSELTDPYTITITADGRDLGEYTPSQLGGYTDAQELADQAYAVGRGTGPVSFVTSGIAMARGLLGISTELSPAILYDEDDLEDAVADIAAEFDLEPLDGSYELTRDGLFATKHQDGRALDREALAAAITESTGGEIEASWPPLPAEPLDLEAMAAELSTEATPAHYDIETGKVVDGTVGVTLDVEAAEYAMDAALNGETVKLPAEVTFPTVTAAELEEVLFRDLLSTCTTKVSGTSTRKNNVKLSGEAVNGTILNDGDIFDYNKVVGKRTTERGYGPAPSYINGETVDSIGGGICQTSSTIYLASLLANLEIVERYAHRYYPSYITMGMDATVSWGGPEFRFKNNTGYPIRIDVVYENSEITVNIYGTKTDDTYVKMTREVLSSTGYETEYVETEELPWGTQKQKQSGYTGYEVKSYRNIYDGDGNLISSTLEATSSYKSRNEIILVGIAGRPEGGDTGDNTGGGSGGETTDPGGSTETGGTVDPGPGPDTGPPGWLS